MPFDAVLIFEDLPLIKGFGRRKIGVRNEKNKATSQKEARVQSILAIMITVSLLASNAPVLERKDGGFYEKRGKTEAISAEAAELLFPKYRPTGILREACGELPEGTVVELLTAESYVSYTVFYRGGEYTVPWSALAPLPEASSAPSAVTDREIEAAASAFGLTSETPYLLWTDLLRLETYLLHRESDSWQVLRRIPCSAGDTAHPTPRGSFRVSAHRASLGGAGYLTVYALHIVGDYLYHSVLLTPEGNELADGRLGARISHGCIRHSVEDSRYLYGIVPDGTTVLIR